MSQSKSLMGCFLRATILPVLVVFVVSFFEPNFWSIVVKYPWYSIFAVGILASLYTQLVVHDYFKNIGGYHKLTIYTSGAEEFFHDLFPVLTALLVVCALVSIDNFAIHILCTLAYLLAMTAMDALVWLRARPDPKVQGGAGRDLGEFKRNCRELCLRVDGAIFVVIAVWVVLLIVMERMDQEGWGFYLASELPLKVKQMHLLKEPLLAGVIGCHMFLSIILISIHLRDWRDKVAPGRTLQPGEEPA